MMRTVCWSVVVAMAAGTAFGGEPDGKEIFERVWTANDERSHGGDGLGPVFNANSCVACHDQGGAGGGGALDKNVHLLTVQQPALPRREHFQAIPEPPRAAPAARPDRGPLGAILESFLPSPDPVPSVVEPADLEVTEEQAKRQFENALAAVKRQRVELRKQLVAKLHPEFETSDTVVLHAKGTDTAAHARWKQRLTNANTGLHGNLVPQQTMSFDPVGVNQFETMQLGGPIGVEVQTLAFNGVVGNDFPVLSELQGKTRVIQSQANPMASFAVPFHGGSLQRAQRNTTALWGAGVIDRIPSEAIEALAKKQQEAGGRISGRPHRLADGSLGRFGWKAQKGSLKDFTIAACANELGLEVPGAKQATVAYTPDYEAKGLDLDEKELDALVDYIGSLPVPAKQVKRDTVAAITSGHELFVSIGCAECHVEDVGEAKGVFTDLLLHDMGPALGSVGSYGVPMTPEPDPQDVPIASAEGEKTKPVPPTSREWRTPPLWGVGSSAPYLHDGRAKTIEQAIAFHGGEASESRLRFLLLKPAEQKQLLGFLNALVAPEAVASRE